MSAPAPTPATSSSHAAHSASVIGQSCAQFPTAAQARRDDELNRIEDAVHNYVRGKYHSKKAPSDITVLEWLYTRYPALQHAKAAAMVELLMQFDGKCWKCGLRFKPERVQTLDTEEMHWHHIDGSRCKKHDPVKGHDHVGELLNSKDSGSLDKFKNELNRCVPVHDCYTEAGPPVCHALLHPTLLGHRREGGQHHPPTACPLHPKGCPLGRHHHNDGCVTDWIPNTGHHKETHPFVPVWRVPTVAGVPDPEMNAHSHWLQWYQTHH